MRIAITGSWRDQDAARWNLRNKASFFEAADTPGCVAAPNLVQGMCLGGQDQMYNE